MTSGPTVRREEILIAAIARLLEGVRHVATGASSPIPGAAALLARRRAGGRMRVSILGSRKNAPFTNGGVELFDCAAEGRLDAFFLGGGEIDGEANINLVGTGDYPRSDVRFPGSFGSAYLYFLVPRVILFREEHTRRVMVPKVSFISAPGTSPEGVYRPGGPIGLLTGLCWFRFDRERKRFVLETIHPGVTVDDVRDATGFDFDCPASAPATPEPDAETLALIRGPIGGEIAEAYPAFAERLFGAKAA